MLRPSILILLVLQISAVFCRSTANYEDGATEIGTGAVNFNETLKDNKEFLNQSAVGQGTVQYGDDYEYYRRRAAEYQFTVLLAVSISMGVFVLGSLILGFILYLCCRSKPKQGFIVRSTTVNQASGVQQRPVSIAMQPPSSNLGNMQQYPPTVQPMKQPATNPYQSSHQQNPYPVQPHQQ